MCKPEEMTNKALFFAYMSNRDAIARLYVAQKEIEDEWKRRKPLMMDRHLRGELNMKLDDKTLKMLEGDAVNEHISGD